MKSKSLAIIAAVLASSVLAGCAVSGQGSRDYTRGQARGEMTVRLGVVESVRDVKIEASRNENGQVIGAGLGGIAGSTAGGGSRANAAGAIAGAVIGAVVGSAIDKSASERQGVEVTVKLEGGQLIAITQEKDEEFKVGDRVRILSGQGTSRVARF
jgi:outer membrane lipoprotein SlyB